MKKKVLVIDDEVDLLKIIKLNLEETDSYEVSTLSSARDIVSQVRIFKPDIILLDILMPGFDGIETCQMLNKDPIGEHIPVIMLSALDKNVDKLKTFKAGATDCLVKPIKKEDLIRKIEKCTQFMQ